MNLESPANLHFVACDVERESVAKALSRSAYRAGEPAFFAWLGATMFLMRDVILDILCSIPTVARMGTQLVFDYIDVDAFEHEKVSDRLKRTMEVLCRLGEPMITGFAPSALAGELAGVGFRLIEDLAPEDLQSRFFSRRTDGFHATEHFHLARAEVV